jgi:hypothetical protein
VRHKRIEIVLGRQINAKTKRKDNLNQSMMGSVYAYDKEDVDVKEKKSIWQKLIIAHNSKWKNIFDFIVLI